MKILTVNAGSSSLKFNLIELPEEKELISGYFEKIGLANGIYSLKINGSKIRKEADMRDHKAAIELLIKELLDNKIIDNCDIILAVTRDHKKFIESNFCVKDNKLFTISEFVDECCDIVDPYMGDIEIYRGTLLKLDYLLNKVLDKLNEFGG